MSEKTEPMRLQAVRRALFGALRLVRRRGPSQVQFWFIALAIGVAAGGAAVLFRLGIDALQAAFYGTDDPSALASHARDLAWYWILTIPIFGGLLVGIVVNVVTPDGRVRGVSQVIEGAALHGGRMERDAGLVSALASLVTLSSGGSTGREGPVVHLAGVMASWVSERIRADGVTGRDLLGCAVAAAVSASFNAPIAGALFAMEVVLRHFAMHAFAPIVIAAAAGTVINRLRFGDVTEFNAPAEGLLALSVELPAFLLLGLLSGLVAAIFMRTIFWGEARATALQARFGVPRFARPALAGALLGAIAIAFPHIIGVGYETTSDALTGALSLREAVVFAVLKVIAVAITIAGRMGGGVFSPSLMLGALTGLAFGLVATALVPGASGGEALYALAGMGAVAAAVLGAPISMTLIVFELTGDWQVGLAVLVSVSMSSAVASKLVTRSFFLTELERRGVPVAEGPQSYLLAMFRVANVMRAPDDPRAAPSDAVWEAIEAGVYVNANATLKEAMPVFERSGRPFLPVVTIGATGEPPKIRGALFHVDALEAYARALAATAREEHS